MRKANFFILGAAKSGTTSLANYLDEHPEIFISKPKEPNFFATELPKKYPRIKTKKDYDILFDEASEQAKILGDASTMYLPSPKALDNIIRYNDQAKFLIIIRNPIRMSESWHSHKLYYLEEEEEDFEVAWELQKERKQGENVPKRCLDPSHLQYLDFCSVGSQIERVLDRVNEDKLLIVFLDDLKEKPKETYQKILHFLQVREYEKENFETLNQNKKSSSKWIQRIITSFSFETIGKIKAVKRRLGLEHVSLVRFIEKKNRKHTKRKPINREFKQRLVSAFEKEIKKIEKITNRDLSEWRQV